MQDQIKKIILKNVGIENLNFKKSIALNSGGFQQQGRTVHISPWVVWTLLEYKYLTQTILISFIDKYNVVTLGIALWDYNIRL